MATETFYSDLDLTFKIHPIRKDLMLSTNEQAVIRSVRNLVLTNHYERLFQSEIGSNINKMLFENFSPFTSDHLKREIYEVVKIFEPRISQLIVDVKQQPDEHTLVATLQFYINNSTNITTVDILLERTR